MAARRWSSPYSFRFTPQERDRRWQAVRLQAGEQDLDAVLVPPCVDGDNLRLSLESARGTRADCRYLTLLEHAAVIIPSDGRPAVVLSEYQNDWVPDPRSVDEHYAGLWSDAMTDSLRGLGLASARIGVAGLGRGRYTHARANDGVVNHVPYARLLAALPDASFVDATDVVGAARYVKGEEELAALRLGSVIAEAGVETLCQLSRPGLEEAQLYAAVMRRMLDLGSEYYNLAMVTGPAEEGLAAQVRVIDPRPGRRLAPMQLVDCEVDALLGGLIAQEKQAVLLGDLPRAWQSAEDLQLEMFETGLSCLSPGKTVGELIDAMEALGRSAGLRVFSVIHGRGYGNDGPLLTPGDLGSHVRDVEFKENNVFVWKPLVATADGRHHCCFGGNVVVTAKGAVPMFSRPRGTVCNV